MLPHCAHTGSHITRKCGVYYYRRLPETPAGEIALSLGTRNFREAQHLAGILDRVFGDAVTNMRSADDLKTILRAYIGSCHLWSPTRPLIL